MQASNSETFARSRNISHFAPLRIVLRMVMFRRVGQRQLSCSEYSVSQFELECRPMRRHFVALSISLSRSTLCRFICSNYIMEIRRRCAREASMPKCARSNVLRLREGRPAAEARSTAAEVFRFISIHTKETMRKIKRDSERRKEREGKVRQEPTFEQRNQFERIK